MGRTITVNGRTFAETDTVPWSTAVAAGGFYFARARYLGLGEPTAVLFDEAADGYLRAAADYHRRFEAAEYAAVRQLEAAEDDDDAM